MPFDEEDNDLPSAHSQKVGLKNVSSQKSIFESMPKKPTQDELDTKVRAVQDRNSSYKNRAATLAVNFHKVMADKTLPQNKNSFQKEIETELLKEMINFASDINNDPNEKEGIGSISMIALLLKNSITQRDKINLLEYHAGQIEKKTDPAILRDLVCKEIAQALDNKKKSE